MVLNFRTLICNKVVKSLNELSNFGRPVSPDNILPHIKVCQSVTSGFEYELPLYKTNDASSINGEQLLTLFRGACASDIVEKLSTGDTITAAYLYENVRPKIKFKVCPKAFTSEILSNVQNSPHSFWASSDLLSTQRKKKIVVEFSSPNIAKPFHVGHLRSTIIGNFVANLHRCLGHDVVRINYLGDWGTQFGLLKYGYDAKGMTSDDLKENAIKSLYNLYVWANKESQKRAEIHEKAKAIFNEMENSSESRHLDSWRTFRDLSVAAYEKLYARLNVRFDQYHGESMYNRSECVEIVRKMESCGLLVADEQGRKVYKSVDEANKPPLTVVKSDGSTVYITRDIAAAHHRFREYAFDEMFYVVDNSQHDHFCALTRILAGLGAGWSHRLKHVKFGRVQGMSTRKGTAVFLQDVLDEAKHIMLMKQNQSKNTALSDAESAEEVADTVGCSAIIVSDLKRRRKKNYSFSWDAALQNTGNTGVRLQYTHCRLVRLQRKSNVCPRAGPNLECLSEPEAQNIVRHIARYDEVLLQCMEELESCILAQYLFELCDAINAAFKALPVKGSSAEVAEARMTLFWCARATLSSGMRVLGVRPLDQM